MAAAGRSQRDIYEDCRNLHAVRGDRRERPLYSAEPTNNPISRSHTPPRCGFFGLADATSGTVGFDGFGRGEAEDEAANEVARGDAVSSMTGVELRRVIVESQTPVGAAERGDSLRHGVTLFFQTGARLDLSPSAFPWEVRLQLHVYKTLPRKSALGYRCTGRLSHWLP